MGLQGPRSRLSRSDDVPANTLLKYPINIHLGPEYRLVWRTDQMSGRRFSKMAIRMGIKMNLKRCGLIIVTQDLTTDE